MWKTAFAAAAMLAAILPSSIANAGQKGDFWRDAPAYNWSDDMPGLRLAMPGVSLPRITTGPGTMAWLRWSQTACPVPSMAATTE